MARREKSRSGFWVGIISFVLVVAIILTVFGVGTTGFKDWSFSRFFPKSRTEQSQTTGSTIIGSGESSGIALTSMQIPVEEYEAYGVDRTVNSAYNLTATFTPANTTFQEVDYSIYFDTTSKPEYATWAQNKTVTNYGTITQTADGSCTATFTVKQSFSAPIMVKVTSRRDSNISATIRADFVYMTPSLRLTDTSSVADDIVWQFSWSDGTLAPTPSQSKAEVIFYFDSYFVGKMKEYGYTVESTYSEPLSFNEGTWEVDCDISNIRNILMNLGGDAAKNDPSNYWGAVCRAMLNGREPVEGNDICVCTYDLKYTRVYNGVIYTQETIVDDRSDFYVEEESEFEIRATGMGVTEEGGSSSLVFG